MAETRVENYQGTRITIQSSSKFDDMSARLYSSIGEPSHVAWPVIAKSIKRYSDKDKAEFTTTVDLALGPHGFMIFQKFNHGAWIPLFGIGSGRKSKRVIPGNPLVGITMLEHDLTAGLAVPVEFLLLENENKTSTSVVYQLPSGLIAGINKGPELLSAVGELDEKLEILVQYIASWFDRQSRTANRERQV